MTERGWEAAVAYHYGWNSQPSKSGIELEGEKKAVYQGNLPLLA
jgi:hypothetical protein